MLSAPKHTTIARYSFIPPCSRPIRVEPGSLRFATPFCALVPPDMQHLITRVWRRMLDRRLREKWNALADTVTCMEDWQTFARSVALANYGGRTMKDVVVTCNKVLDLWLAGFESHKAEPSCKPSFGLSSELSSCEEIGAKKRRRSLK